MLCEGDLLVSKTPKRGYIFTITELLKPEANKLKISLIKFKRTKNNLQIYFQKYEEEESLSAGLIIRIRALCRK